MSNQYDAVPVLDWVFCFSPLLGGVSRSWRSAAGEDAQASAPQSVAVSSGVRWYADCGSQASAHGRDVPATARNLAKDFGPLGRGFGSVATVAVVSEGRLTQDVAWLAHHFDDPSAKESVVEWSLALVRECDRTREGIRVVGPGSLEMITMLRRDIGVDYWLTFASGEQTDAGSQSTSLQVRCPGTSGPLGPLEGSVWIESESVPPLFSELGRRYGNGLRLADQAGIAVTRWQSDEVQSGSGGCDE